MLFNSFEFLLLFLPLTLVGFYFLARFRSVPLVLAWLVLCSLFFHGYWKASYTWLFLCSMVVNYLFGLACLPALGKPAWQRRATIIAAVIFNLGLLAYFKYAGFLAGVVWQISGYFFNPGDIVLPLAISFYTFQQISFLVDTYRGRCPRYGFMQYAAYLAFFPHLIAGPIVRHDNLIHQMGDKAILHPKAENFLSGMAIIMIGLFKKVVLADGAAAYVNPVFFAAGNGAQIGFVEGWLAAVLFSFVIYFDFSGYSDIAIGLARLFNVRFPENFASPYKATNIVEFWRRWHITLSYFLRQYLYIPIGGNRKGTLRRYSNIMVTMLVGGLWHGAGWNFIIWGGLHGIYLAIAHAWRHQRQSRNLPGNTASGRLVARIATYLAVVIAWVFFRATTLDQACVVLSAMVGLTGFGLHVEMPAGLLGNPVLSAAAMSVVLLAIVNLLPNTQQFMRYFQPVIHSSSEEPSGYARRIVWKLNFPSICFVAALGVYAISQMEYVQSFIYFRF